LESNACNWLLNPSGRDYFADGINPRGFRGTSQKSRRMPRQNPRTLLLPLPIEAISATGPPDRCGHPTFSSQISRQYAYVFLGQNMRQAL
jgi:hypothetical protein